MLVQLAGREARVGAQRGQALQRGELRLDRLALAAEQRHQPLGRAEGGAAARVVLWLLADAREDAQA